MLTIDPEFAALIPPQRAWEVELLKESLVAEGCREPIRHCQFGILDGMTRFRLCTELGIAFQNEELEISDRQAAIQWMVRWQVGRRSLNKTQAKYLWGKAFAGQTPPTDLMKASGLTRRSLHRAKKFAEAVDKLDPAVRHEILEHGSTQEEVEGLSEATIEEQNGFVAKKRKKRTENKTKANTANRARTRKRRSDVDLFPKFKEIADEPFWDASIQSIDTILSQVNRVANSPAGAFFTQLEMVVGYLERCRTAFDVARYHCACEKCGSSGGTEKRPCEYCRGQGWLTKWRAEEISAFESYDD